MNFKRIIFMLTSIILALTILFNLCSCQDRIYAQDLTKDIKISSAVGKQADDRFINSQLKLCAELFKSVISGNESNNVLISPLSVQLALSMTANGADGETKAEMERLLGGEISVDELNKYLYSYVNGLPSGDKSKLKLANSVWFKNTDSLSVNEDFLKNAKSYYDAYAFKADFDQKTVKSINNWVDKNTDGMIDHIVDEISPNAVMYIINTLIFDAEWDSIYHEYDVDDGTFNSISGEIQTVSMMHSTENIYLESENATGFVKYYKDCKYGFAALLPNKDISIYDYIDTLSAESLSEILENAQDEAVTAAIPKFSYEYSLTMNDMLCELGMQSAFDVNKADFSKLATSSNGNICIGKVLHKTYISVNELGTKAGAATIVEMDCGSSMPPKKTVTLDRPFLFMIIDTATNLPIFIGTVVEIG